MCVCVYVCVCLCVCVCMCVYVCVCTNFLAKEIALTLLAKICPKMDLGLEIQKNKVGIRISILDIPCVPTLSQNRQC